MRINGWTAACCALSIMAGFVVSGAVSVNAQSPPNEYQERAESPMVPQEAGFGETAPIFRDSIYGDRPHYGEPDAPAFGHPHYELPSRRYGIWYRPRDFGLGRAERCQPSDFRPRGYGNLFNRPSTCYRMDYRPYVMQETVSRFGPSYYRQQPDGRCTCDHCAAK